MESTMQDRALTLASLFDYGRRVFGDSEVVTCTATGSRRATFDQVAERSMRLGAALRHLGVERGDRVATFCWNTQEHLEAYLAIPSIGAVLHTLNIRLFLEQISYIANHAKDRII